jgi:hypothetical protein
VQASFCHLGVQKVLLVVLFACVEKITLAQILEVVFVIYDYLVDELSQI